KESAKGTRTQQQGVPEPLPISFPRQPKSMAFRVEISAQAETDANSILEWLLSHHVGEAGVRWFFALDDAIRSLGTFLNRCPLAPESGHFSLRGATTSLRSQTPHLS